MRAVLDEAVMLLVGERVSDTAALIETLRATGFCEAMYERKTAIAEEWQCWERRLKRENWCPTCDERTTALDALAARLQQQEGIDRDLFTMVCFERDELSGKVQQQEEALRLALDCRGSYNGTVSEDGGNPAICTKCEQAVRAALAADGVMAKRTAAPEDVARAAELAKERGWADIAADGAQEDA